MLKPHPDYYDRLPTTHPDRCYSWVSQLIDTLVSKAQQKKNTESLVLDASGLDQTPARPTRPAMPGQRQDPPGDGTVRPERPAGGSSVTAGGGNDGPKGGGKRRGKKGRGNGGDETDVGTNPSDGDARSVNASIPQDQKCCIKHLWGKCPNPESCIFGLHLDRPTEGIKQHGYYKQLVARLGEPTGPAAASSAAASAKQPE